MALDHPLPKSYCGCGLVPYCASLSAPYPYTAPFYFHSFFTYVFFLFTVLPVLLIYSHPQNYSPFSFSCSLPFYFFTFISDLISCIISCHYSCLCLFPISFYSSCPRSFAIIPHFLVSLSLRLVLFFISFFIIYGLASFLSRPQNSKGC